MQKEEQKRHKEKQRLGKRVLYYMIIPIGIITLWSTAHFFTPEMEIAPQIEPYVEFQSHVEPNDYK